MRSLAYCILLLSLSLESCSFNFISQQLAEGNESEKQIALEIVEYVIEKSHWDPSKFLVIFENFGAEEIKFFKCYPDFSWRLHSNTRPINLTSSSNVIIFTQNFDSLNKTLSVINVKPMPSQTKFVISVAENFVDLQAIKKSSVGSSEGMWSLDKSLVLYLVPRGSEILAMTYFAFSKNCRVGDLEILDIWREGNFQKNGELFPEKLLDLNGCPQYHSVIFDEGMTFHVRKEFSEKGEMIIGGVGGRLIAIVAEKMNIDLRVLAEHTSVAARWELVNNELSQGKTLVSISGSIPMARRLRILHMDVTYMQESLAFGYMVGGFEVSWKNLVWPLSSFVWVQLGIIGLLFSGLLFAAHHFHRRGIIPDNLSFLDGFAIFLGISVALPRNYFGRYVFGIWIFHSYLTVTAYNSGLVSFLTTPHEKRIIRTFEDLLDDGLEFGGGKFHREFYNDPEDPVIKRIYDKFKVFPINEALRLPTIPKIATGVLTSTVRVYNTIHKDNASNQLRMLEDTAFTFHVPIYMRRGSPLARGVHRYASHAIQSGFVDYWMKYYYRPASTSTAKTPSVLTVNHIRGILVLHIAGLVFCSIVFLGEIIYHKQLVGQH